MMDVISKLNIEKYRKYAAELFWIAWSVFLLSLLLDKVIFWYDNSVLTLLTKLLRYGAYLLCVIKIVLDFPRKKADLIEAGVIMAIFFISFIVSRDTTIFLYGFLMFAAVNTDGSKMIRLFVVITSVFMIFLILLSQIGIVEDYLFVRGENLPYRHGLGFSWTTTSSILFFYVVLGVIYLKGEKFNLICAAVSELIVIYLYLMTNTRLVFILSTVVIVFFAAESVNPFRWKLMERIKNWMIWMPMVIGVIAILMFVFYDASNPVWQKINSVLSGRLNLGRSAIDNYGISLFGMKIKWVGFSVDKPTLNEAVGYNYVDSSYLQLLIEHGIMSLLCILWIYIKGIIKAIHLRDYYLIIVLATVLFFGITEPRLMNLGFNPFPLIAFCTLQRPKRKDGIIVPPALTKKAENCIMNLKKKIPTSK